MGNMTKASSGNTVSVAAQKAIVLPLKTNIGEFEVIDTNILVPSIFTRTHIYEFIRKGIVFISKV